MHLLRLYHTLADLRIQQLVFRLWHPLKRRFMRLPAAKADRVQAALRRPAMALFTLPVYDRYLPQERAFELLHLKQEFPQGIDWSFLGHGHLWRFHLHYFLWLDDASLSVASRLDTLRAFAAEHFSSRSDALASYTISLRNRAIIRFCLRERVYERWLAELVYRHSAWLYHFPEYHLQGNHLWENACSLLCSGLYFQDSSFIRKGAALLQRSLEEQVLEDGGHIEGSPMYHSLLLAALLQCIELAVGEGGAGLCNLLPTMRTTAERMLGWLRQMTFRDGSWPQVNDATGDLAPPPQVLEEWAAKLQLHALEMPLAASGYRKFRLPRYEVLVAAGSIRPAWQPGHAHAHEGTFCLSVGETPVIVDPGVHTYAPGLARSWERGTDAHNTLAVKGKNASDVWKSFRVGRKARVSILEEDAQSIRLSHDGYNFSYMRHFQLSDQSIILEDIADAPAGTSLQLNLHFHPNIILKKYGDYEFLAGNLLIIINGAFQVDVESYPFSIGFNRQAPAQRLHIKTGNHTLTRLQLLNAD